MIEERGLLLLHITHMKYAIRVMPLPRALINFVQELEFFINRYIVISLIRNCRSRAILRLLIHLDL